MLMSGGAVFVGKHFTPQEKWKKRYTLDLLPSGNQTMPLWRRWGTWSLAQGVSPVQRIEGSRGSVWAGVVLLFMVTVAIGIAVMGLE